LRQPLQHSWHSPAAAERRIRRQLDLDARGNVARDPQEGAIAGHAARIYELAPEPEPDDIDGRMPSVVTWHDGEMVFLIASGELPVADLIPIAASMYAPHARP